MVDFQKFYNSFLGIDKNNSAEVISCERRNEPFCLVFKQLLIMTQIDNNKYYSIAPQFFLEFKNNYNPSNKAMNPDDYLLEIDNTFCNFMDRYSINKNYRLSYPENYISKTKLSEKVVTLNDSNKELYFKLLGKRGIKFKENQWSRLKQLIEEERYYILIDNNEIAAYSFLSNIDNGGANIVVVTLPKYRRKGYGKAVVTKSTEWCLKNELIPIYLVDQSNTASINLAKSLGFETMSEEIIISV